MWRLDRDKVSRWDDLKDLKLSDFKGFASLMSKLFCDCDAFEPDLSLREIFNISDEELRSCIYQTLSEIEIYYP